MRNDVLALVNAYFQTSASRHVSRVWCTQLGHKFLVTSFWYQKLGRRTWVVCHGP